MFENSDHAELNLRSEEFRPKHTSQSKIGNVLISGVGFLADAFDLFVIDFVLAILSATAFDEVTAADKSFVVSSTLAGAVIGQLFFGIAADFLGRRKMFVATATLVILGSISSSLVGWNYTSRHQSFNVFHQLGLCRFFLGLGIGGEYPLSATVAAENETREELINKNAELMKGCLWYLTHKPNSIAAVFSMQGLGMLLSPLLVMLCVSCNLSLETTWRLCLSLGAIPSAVAFAFRWRMSETAAFQQAQEDLLLNEAATRSTSTVSQPSPTNAQNATVVSKMKTDTVDVLNAKQLEMPDQLCISEQDTVSKKDIALSSDSGPHNFWGNGLDMPSQYSSKFQRDLTKLPPAANDVNLKQTSEKVTKQEILEKIPNQTPSRKSLKLFLAHVKYSFSIIKSLKFVILGTSATWFLIDITLYGTGSFKSAIVGTWFLQSNSSSIPQVPEVGSQNDGLRRFLKEFVDSQANLPITEEMLAITNINESGLEANITNHKPCSVNCSTLTQLSENSNQGSIPLEEGAILEATQSMTNQYRPSQQNKNSGQMATWDGDIDALSVAPNFRQKVSYNKSQIDHIIRDNADHGGKESEDISMKKSLESQSAHGPQSGDILTMSETRSLKGASNCQSGSCEHCQPFDQASKLSSASSVGIKSNNEKSESSIVDGPHQNQKSCFTKSLESLDHLSTSSPTASNFLDNKKSTISSMFDDFKSFDENGRPALLYHIVNMRNFESRLKRKLVETENSELKENKVRDVIMFQAFLGTIVALLSVPGYILSLLFIHRIGTRRLQFWGFIATAIIFILLGLEQVITVKGSPVLELILFGLTFLTSNFGPNTTTFIIPTQVYPTILRATCHGFSAAMGKVGGVVGTSLFSIIEEHFKLGWLLVMCGLVSFAGAAFTLFIPKDLKATKQELYRQYAPKQKLTC